LSQQRRAGGYTYERLIHGCDEAYTDVAPWPSHEAWRVFGGHPTDEHPIHGQRVETWGEQQAVLSAPGFAGVKSLRIVDVVVGRHLSMMSRTSLKASLRRRARRCRWSARLLTYDITMDIHM
jgi:TPP-dependent 2-oxoacid decarboxylase